MSNTSEGSVSSESIKNEVLLILNDQRPHRISDIKKQLSSSEQLSDFTEGQISGVMNTLVKNGSVSRVSRGEYIIHTEEKSKKCFIVCPIGDKDSKERNRSDKLYRHVICPVCSEAGFEPIRIDKLNRPDSITENIIEHLSLDDVVVADITGKNPNVFYEIGYRMALKNMPIILMREDGENIPFDISVIRSFEYNLNDLDSVDELKGRLVKAMKQITVDKKNVPVNSDPDMGYVLDTLSALSSKIDDLRQDIQSKDMSMVNALVQASVPKEDPNVAVMKAILPELIKNPEALQVIMKMSSKK